MLKNCTFTIIFVSSEKWLIMHSGFKAFTQRHGGLELCDCWMATLRRVKGGASSGRTLTSRDVC